jgi:hypothetical protein
VVRVTDEESIYDLSCPFVKVTFMVPFTGHEEGVVV